MTVGSSSTDARIARGSDKFSSGARTDVSGTDDKVKGIDVGIVSELAGKPTGGAETLQNIQAGLNVVIFLHGAQKERLLVVR
jgi:hypothetical protein